MSVKLDDSKSYKVDWLSFTKPVENNDPLITAKKFFDNFSYDLDLFEEIPGRFFYNSGLTIGNYINLYYNDPAKEKNKYSPDSINVVFTGNGCTDLGYRLEDLSGYKDYEKNWLQLFSFLTSYGYKITRADIALDIFSNEIDMDLMADKLKAGHYRSVKKTYSINRGADQKGRESGFTIYIGRNVKNSEGVYYTRIYNKLAEFQSKHELPPRKAREAGAWFRVEQSFTKKKAIKIINEILKAGNLGEPYFGVLKSTIEFLEPRYSKNGKLYPNKAFWTVSPWWQKFLQDAKTLRIGSDAIRDVEFGDLLKYLRVQVVPSLRLLELLGKNTNPKFDIYQLIKSCEIDGFSKKQKRLYNNTINLSPELISLYLKQFKEGYK